MYQNFRKFLVIYTLLASLWVTGVQSQCGDCDRPWQENCTIYYNGHSCLQSSHLSTEELDEGSPNHIDYSKCVPKAYPVSEVKGFCCVWSEVFGCRMVSEPAAIAGSGYPLYPCDGCYRNHCPCNKAKARATKSFDESARGLLMPRLMICLSIFLVGN